MSRRRLSAVLLAGSTLALVVAIAPTATAATVTATPVASTSTPVDCPTTAPFDPRVGAIQPTNGTLSTSFQVTFGWSTTSWPAGCDATVVIAITATAAPSGAAPPPGPVTVPAIAGTYTTTLNAPAQYAFQAQLVVNGVAGPWSPAQQFTLLPLDYCTGWVHPPSGTPVSGQALDPTSARLSVNIGPQDPLHVTLCGTPTAIATAVGDPTAPVVTFPPGSITTTVVTGLTPGRTYRWTVYVNNTVYGTVTITQPPTPGGCLVGLQVTGGWSTYHQITATITAAGPAALTGWRVSWASNGTVTQLWNGVLATDPTTSTTTVTNTSYNGPLAPGQTTTFGFIVNGGDWSTTPTGLNCQPATG
jgi:hypothetical protein